MADLGQAYVQIMPTAKGIKAGIEQTLEPEVSSAGSSLGAKFASIFSGGLGKKIALAGASIAGLGVVAGNALKKGIMQTAEYGDHVDKMSQKIGFSAEGYQKWDYVLQRAGTSIDKMQPVMKTLSTQAMENSDAFQKLGISQEEVANMSQEELFSKTITELSKMENQTERTALAGKLLGRGATELGPLLNGGTEAIKEQMEIAEKYGMIMPDSAVKASAAFQDSLTTMQMTMTGLKNRMMAEFLPSATLVTDGLGKLFAGDVSGADDIIAGISGITAKLGELIPKVIEIGGKIMLQLGAKIVESLPALISGIGNMINGVVQFLATNTAAITETIKGVTESIINFLISNGPNILAGIFQIFMAVNAGIGSALIDLGTQLLDGAGKAIGEFVGGLGAGAGDIIQAGLELLGNLIKGIINGIKAIPKTVTSLINSFTKSGSQQSKGASAVGTDLVSNIVSGLFNALGNLIQAVGSLVTSAINKFLSGDWIGTGLKAIGKVVTGIGNAVANVVTAIGSLVTSAINKFTGGSWANAGTEAINKIKNALTSAGSAIKDVLGSLADKAINFFKGKGWTASGQEAGQKTADGVRSKSGAAQSAGSAIGSSAVGGVNSQHRPGFDAGVSFTNKVKSGMGSNTDTTNIGRTLGAGVALGLARETANTIAAGVSLVAQTMSRMMGAAHPGSPSKWTNKYVGQILGAGVALGLKVQEPNATRQGVGLVENVMDRMQQEADGFTAKINTEVGMTATTAGALTPMGQAVALLQAIADKDVAVYLDGEKVSDELTPYINRRLGEAF